MEKIKIDINADVGEGIEAEEQFIPYLSSCSIACGGHYGNADSIRKTLMIAKHFNVKVGAHPSFPDRENFGRKVMDIFPDDLQNSIEEQLTLFKTVLDDEGMTMNHIKAHGALYNLAARDELIANVFLDACSKVFSDYTLYLPYNSILEAVAMERGVAFVNEAFGDRAYDFDGSLVNRSVPGSVLNRALEIFRQIEKIALDKEIVAINGAIIKIQGESYCIHGDNPKAKHILHYINTALEIHDKLEKA